MMVAGGSAVAVLTLTALALATSTDLFHQGQTSAPRSVDAHPTAQPTRSAKAEAAVGPTSDLAVAGTALTDDAARGVARAWFLERGRAQR
jgi:hypothetical protein